jgi:TonB-dependent SusC/RagA subfamily outer membrane receptor
MGRIPLLAPPAGWASQHTGSRHTRQAKREPFRRAISFQKGEKTISPDTGGIMSLSLSRAARTHVGGIFALGTLLVALGGCRHSTSAIDQPSPTGRVRSARGQLNDELVPRRFPGVDVIPTRRGGFFVRIHSGLVGAGEPMYLIDGAPVMVDPSRGIDLVKLEDVLQIRVLKDPAETAVYGPRGVNGVVFITTKQVERMRKKGR